VVGWKVVTIAARLLACERSGSFSAPQARGRASLTLRWHGRAFILPTSGMRGDRGITERILSVLRPYASNWTGTLGRGDLVIPQREIPRVIHDILDALHEDAATHQEAGDRELLDALMTARRSASVQDQAEILRRHFLVLLR
jgi:hypothetical protein